MPGGHWPESRIGLLGGMLLNEDASGGGACAEVVLRSLTGNEEEWLAGNRGTPNALTASRLLDACVLRVDGAAPPAGVSRLMLAGDRDFLVLQLRRLTLGDRVRAVLECPACRSKMDLDFDAAGVPAQERPQTAVWHSMDLAGRSIRFRLPAGADQEFIAGMDPEPAAGVLFNRCVDAGEGPPLDDATKKLVIEAMDHEAPQVNLELDLKCPECGEEFTAPFDMTSFFFDEMRVHRTQFFREVHSLAFYYHWTEADILAMARERRRMYLSLLSDALREE